MSVKLLLDGLHHLQVTTMQTMCENHFELSGWKSTEMQNLVLPPREVWQQGAALLGTGILRVLKKYLQGLLPCPGFTGDPG